MTKLSPAARAVLEAVTWKKYDVPPEGLPAFAEEMAPLLAVALRTAADHSAPVPTRGSKDMLLSFLTIRHRLLAIADELEKVELG